MEDGDTLPYYLDFEPVHEAPAEGGCPLRECPPRECPPRECPPPALGNSSPLPPPRAPPNSVADSSASPRAGDHEQCPFCDARLPPGAAMDVHQAGHICILCTWESEVGPVYVPNVAAHMNDVHPLQPRVR